MCFNHLHTFIANSDCKLFVDICLKNFQIWFGWCPKSWPFVFKWFYCPFFPLIHVVTWRRLWDIALFAYRVRPIKQALETGNAVIIVRSNAVIAIVMTACFFLCNFGEDTSNRFIALSDSIYMKSWQYCPLDEQKLFPFMIMIGQKPVYMKGFAKLTCSRETFKKVFFVCGYL